MSIEFFVATDDELAKIDDIDELFDLSFQYDINAAGANNFEAVRDLCKFFFQDEIYVPNQVIKTLNDVLDNQNYTFRIYKIDQKFVEGVANFEKSKLDNSEASKYWHSKYYHSQAIWNCMYGVHNLCLYAVRD